MILYDKMRILSNTTSTTNGNEKIIYASFNKNTREVIHGIAIYKPPKMKISYFISI
jgi:nucleoside diphosphate kinase